jgi:ElaB/YqjD/DUF883 family membrane-anchored ribosome-binding protein
MAEAQKTSSGNGGRTGAADVDRELTALKNDMARLSEDVTKLVSAGSNQAMRTVRGQVRRAKRGFDDAVSDAGEMGREAVDSMREARDSLAEMVDESIEERPYTTLALALAAGFVLGAAWRK